MRIEFVQKNYSMGEKLEEIIRKKAGRLQKYFQDETALKVMLKKEGEVYKMELTANLSGTFIRSEVEGENMYDNIDILLPKIEKQLLKHKTKLQKKLKKEAFKENEFLFLQAEPEIKYPKVVRVKKFDLTPMTTEDAIDALDMIGHDFYIYLDQKTGNTCVIYRREDGTIGLLEPTVAG